MQRMDNVFARKNREKNFAQVLDVRNGKQESQVLLALSWLNKESGHKEVAYMTFGSTEDLNATARRDQVYKLAYSSSAAGKSKTSNSATSKPGSSGPNSAANAETKNVYRPPTAPLVAKAAATDKGKRNLSKDDLIGFSQNESKLRATLLAQDPELEKLHRDLVGGGILSETQFWEGRAQELAIAQANRDAQQKGTASNYGMNVVQTESDENTVKFNVTSQVIARVFFENPDVHAKYKEYVPHRLSEEEFWTMYFHSKYFHRQAGSARKTASGQTGGVGSSVTAKSSRSRGSKTGAAIEIAQKAESLFGYPWDENEKELEKKNKEQELEALKSVDPEVNLINTMEDLPVTTGVFSEQAHVMGSRGLVQRDSSAADAQQQVRDIVRDKRARGDTISNEEILELAMRPIDSAPIVHQYNKHGTRVLGNGQLDGNLGHGTQTAREFLAKHDSLREDLQQYQLNRRKQARYSAIHLKDQSSVHGGVGTGDTNTSSQNPINEKSQAQQVLHDRALVAAQSLKEWKKSTDVVLPDALVCTRVLNELEQRNTTTAARKLKLRGGATARKLVALDESFKTYFFKCFNATNELCRHFWAAYKKKPTSKTFDKMKNVKLRMDELLVELQNERRNMLNSNNMAYTANASLLLPLREQLEYACEAFERRLKRRKKR